MVGIIHIPPARRAGEREPVVPLISVVTACFNEEENVHLLYERVKSVFERLPGYGYEHIFIDNASRDGTVIALRKLAKCDRSVKVIVNARNFSHSRSPYHALLQSSGEATICLAADLEDPPELIFDFIKRWEEGYKIVAGVKRSTEDGLVLRLIRRLAYRVLSRVSSLQLIPNFTGFGLYDRVVVDTLRSIDDSYPYFRGLVSEIGFEPAYVYFDKPRRTHGKTKNDFFTLFDMAMLGLVKHSRMPMRFATLAGFFMSAVSLMIAIGYLVAKLIFWNRFEFGQAPILIGIYFFASVQIFFIGVLGEYVGAIHTQVRKLPLVVERERINFT